MPTCVNCGPGTTPAVLTVGDGLELTGTGTPNSPYHIEVDETSSQLALEVRDSATVNFTIFGSGQPNDPYVLTGDTGAVTALTGLSDYSAVAAPNDGEVVTWVGPSTTGHWQSKPIPPATVQATTNASLLTSGILSNDRLSGVFTDRLAGTAFVGDANTLLLPGAYRTATGWTNGPTAAPLSAYALGTLLVSAVGTSVTHLYFAHSSGGSTKGKTYTRTKYNASDWTPWARLADSDEVASVSAAAAAAAVAAIPPSTGGGGGGTSPTFSDGTSGIYGISNGMVLNDGGLSRTELVKQGRLGLLHIAVRTGPGGLNGNAQEVLFGLPSGYIPGSFGYDFFLNANDGNVYHAAIQGGGSVAMRPGPSVPAYTTLFGSVSFVVAA